MKRHWSFYIGIIAAGILWICLLPPVLLTDIITIIFRKVFCCSKRFAQYSAYALLMIVAAPFLAVLIPTLFTGWVGAAMSTSPEVVIISVVHNDSLLGCLYAIVCLFFHIFIKFVRSVQFILCGMTFFPYSCVFLGCVTCFSCGRFPSKSP